MRLATTKQALLSALLILIPLIAAAQETKPEGGGTSSVIALAVAGPRAVLSVLDSKGLSATSEVNEFSRDNLHDLTGESSPIYLEYGVTSAASREYTGVRIEVFEAKNQAGAYGLFSFFGSRANAVQPVQELGSGSARMNGEVVFWKSNYFVRLTDTTAKHSRARSIGDAFVRAVADAIVPTSAVAHPQLLESLPKSSIVPGTERYFLGPEALSSEIEHAREMFRFEGDTEAVMAEYTQVAEPQSQAATVRPNSAVAPAGGSSLRLVIGEYHTPQFATDAMELINSYMSSLPENEQQETIIKRTGNYIVAAFRVRDRQFAESLVNSIEYPYTVKWLRNPLWPTNDPFRAQKAAEMLLSTFGLLGLILLTVLACGTAFGTTMFLKRRKRQQEIFSDAGGMLRLDLDPFESAILGLPPKREE
ncbi:MAG TPA: DUF6599 family protein [Blastocatellia bacterium]|nr:DUF6599 family protein [Blastocatellia bacterium]